MRMTTAAPFRIADGQFICAELELALPIPPYQDVYPNIPDPTPFEFMGKDCDIFGLYTPDGSQVTGIVIGFPNGWAIRMAIATTDGVTVPGEVYVAVGTRTTQAVRASWVDSASLFAALIDVSQRARVTP